MENFKKFEDWDWCISHKEPYVNIRADGDDYVILMYDLYPLRIDYLNFIYYQLNSNDTRRLIKTNMERYQAYCRDENISSSKVIFQDGDVDLKVRIKTEDIISWVEYFIFDVKNFFNDNKEVFYPNEYKNYTVEKLYETLDLIYSSKTSRSDISLILIKQELKRRNLNIP